MGAFWDAVKAEAAAAAKRRAWSIATLGFWEGPDHEGWVTVGDPNCSTCHGRGEYGGLRPFPNDPRSGLAPIRCDCARSLTRRQLDQEREEDAAAAAERKRYRAMQAEIAAALSWDPDENASPEERERRAARARESRRLDAADGRITVCCHRSRCECSRNQWMYEGELRSFPGDTRPFTRAEREKYEKPPTVSPNGTYDLGHKLMYERTMAARGSVPRESSVETGETGETGETACCHHSECECGLNIRYVNGKRTRVPGTQGHLQAGRSPSAERNELAELAAEWTRMRDHQFRTRRSTDLGHEMTPERIAPTTNAPSGADSDEPWKSGVETGGTTVCCRRSECNCGLNIRYVNGKRTRVPGTTMPELPEA
jgi:hypothetical protein